MKRFCILFLLLIVGGRSRAQVLPNGNLETWTTPDHAQNWLTTDDILQALTGFPVATSTTTRTTDKYSGAFAARLETRAVLGTTAIPGALVLGNTLNPTADQPGGLRYGARPTALQLRYKLSGPALATDSAFAGITLTRYVNGHTEVVGEGVLYLRQAAATYTLAIVPVQYASGAAPDSLHVLIGSGSGDHLTAGTVLTVDNIELVGTSMASRAEAAAAAVRLAVFPNPSGSGLFTLAAPEEPALLQNSLIVRDLAGRVVLAEPAAAPGTTTRTIDLHGQPAGVYTLRLITPYGPVTRCVALQ